MSADEFALIRDVFAPLATHEGARALRDDAAVLEARGRLVVTTDTIVEGVHFLSGDPIDTIAMKALRVNVSDLVGKGATPVAALLNLTWPKDRPSDEIAKFAAALGRDLQSFGMSLLGGDTTSTPGPLTITITAFGEPLSARTPSRADAKAGDDVWLVGGEIGSAWLGLQLRSGAILLSEIQRERDEAEAERNNRAFAGQMPDYLTLPDAVFDADAAWLMSTYLAPFVRLETASIVARFANASMDVSDGLLADAGKLAAASGVALRIEANDVPLSIPAQRWAQTGGDFRKLVTGGDDYVVLFTASPEMREALHAADPDKSLRLTRIGRAEAGEGVALVDWKGAAIPIPEAGYSHQLGR
ncbi:MAG: thiamine-phosphate kinase [Caulobacterales bacterium]|jgi:thiamine-monophosphate kinase|nr:thiamine-phosphate kinase [Caulobacterales bacterium]